MSREDEYRAKCATVKRYYTIEVERLLGEGKDADAAQCRAQRSYELEELDRQYREGKPLVGCNIAS